MRSFRFAMVVGIVVCASEKSILGTDISDDHSLREVMVGEIFSSPTTLLTASHPKSSAATKKSDSSIVQVNGKTIANDAFRVLKKRKMKNYWKQYYYFGNVRGNGNGSVNGNGNGNGSSNGNGGGYYYWGNGRKYKKKTKYWSKNWWGGKKKKKWYKSWGWSSDWSSDWWRA